MSIIRWNPAYNSLARWPSIWDEDDLASLMPNAGNNLDVYETADEVVIKANVAGIPTEKVDITFEKGVLWIQARKEEEQEDAQKKHYSKSSWSYSYKVAVPGEIDHTKEPSAIVDNGVITITFKKAEASKPKKLTVKAKNA
jgi:HSP20 family protein